jgi:hypothetical protein
MTVKLKNNAIGYLASAISASDVTASLTAGTGASFPTLGASEYFYATITATNGVFEVVKVTARTTDSLSIVRAQESTSALAFAAGALVELRVTAQAVTDAISDQIDTLETDYFAAAGTGTAVGLNIGSGKTLNATSGTILLPAVTVPAQTADGSVAWDSDNELLTVGTGSTRKTMVDTDSTQTLTNKTLTSPAIASIINTGTLTLPTSTDTLVGRATTDTLTNKTLTSPTLTSPTISGSGTATLASVTTTGNVSVGGTLAVTSTSTFTGTATFNGASVLAAGTASLAPLRFTSGTNLTTPTAGVTEYDGAVFYKTPSANNRGVSPAEHFITLTSTNTLTSQTAAQPIFDGGGGPAGGAITLPTGTYFFECMFSLTSMSATSGSFGFAFDGTATYSQAWTSMATDAALATAANTQTTFNTAANTTLCTASTSTTGYAIIRGIIRVTVSGTLIPSVSQTTAAAAVVGTDSYFRVKQLGSSTAVSVGNWS